MTDIVIAADGLTKRYNGTAAVDRVSFDVARGEIFGVLGPNGAGKTTTILMLLGLSEIDAGKARVLGHDPAREPLTVKRNVGYLPDSVGFYDNLTAVENLHYTARLIGIPPAEREPRIKAALARVGLSEVGDKKVGAYSRGMRQRLGLAEIVMKDARIAILDEPTNGLDPQASVELLDLIRSLKASGVTVLLSSHLLDRVQSICDRVALFNNGRIALIGTIAELGRQVLGGGFAVEVECQGGQNLTERLSEIPGVRSVAESAGGVFRLLCERDVRAEAAAAVVKAGGQLTRLELERASLEQIYTRYFQNVPQEVRDAA
jgi:ABC-2 type transport system ATP-binding protein